MPSNSLIVKKESFFKKIVNFFKNIIKSEKFDYFKCFEEYDYSQDIDYTKEKKRLFGVYNDIKNNNKSIENLNSIDLIVISKMLKEELDIKKKM